MECTGERYMPGHDGDWAIEHMHRYLMACELVAGKDVLDIASGEGYGSHMLSAVAKRVTGVDIDAEAVQLANAKYCVDNLEYIQGSATSIPLPDKSVDVVTSFETIEHLVEHEAMMREIKRVLRPEGLLIMSTPDKRETDLLEQASVFHLKELYRNEFEDLMRAHFAHQRMYGQRVAFGSVVGAEDSSHFISWNKNAQDSRTVGLAQAMFLIVVASDAPVPALPSGLLQAPLADSDTMRQLQAHLQATQQSLLESEQLRLKSEQDRAQAEQALLSILNSRSWQLTRPLRALAGLWRCLRK